MENPIEKVRDLLNRPRSSADFSPAARYAVQRLSDYAEQEHELRKKADDRSLKLVRMMFAANQKARQDERTIDDLRQQLSFMQQSLKDAGM